MRKSATFILIVKPAAQAAPPPPPPLTLDPTGGNLPDEQQGVAVTGDGEFLCKVSGGKPPYQFAISQGTFPKGMDLGAVDNGDGSINVTIAGTPEISGAYSFQLDVIDADGTQASMTANAQPVGQQ